MKNGIERARHITLYISCNILYVPNSQHAGPAKKTTTTTNTRFIQIGRSIKTATVVVADRLSRRSDLSPAFVLLYGDIITQTGGFRRIGVL